MKYYFLALGTIVWICVGCVGLDGQQVLKKTDEYHAPPAAMLQRPGPMVDGPGPGVLPMMAPPPQRVFAAATTQIRFLRPAGMQVGWQIPGGYAENQIVAPGRYSFVQGRSYRLKMTNVPGRAGMVLYPSLQVYPAHPNTDSYLSHASIPIEITDEDLDQVQANNFVTKVIYLPDPKFRDEATAGVGTLVSTRLDPRLDPVDVADRQGTIMAVLRIGNMDLEMPAPQPIGPQGAFGGPGGIQQAQYRTLDGTKDQFAPPLPIAVHGEGMISVPNAMMMAQHGPPGQPSMHPIAGVGGMPPWGMPRVGTPIGLAGPPHLPLGGPASLRTHTIRNLSNNEIPDPVKDVLIDVSHSPGASVPDPVRYIRYEEKHPTYRPNELSYPRWAMPPTGNPAVSPAGPAYGPSAGSAYCPPGARPGN